MMKLFYTLILSTCLLATAAPSMADTKSELAKPIIGLMKHLKAVRKDLKLTEKQDIILDNWMAEAPKRRHELEQEVLDLREELRVALINRDTRLKREELKKKLSEANIRLIEVSSLCARMLHNTLTKEQYAIVVKHYEAERFDEE